MPQRNLFAFPVVKKNYNIRMACPSWESGAAQHLNRSEGPGLVRAGGILGRDKYPLEQQHQEEHIAPDTPLTVVVLALSAAAGIASVRESQNHLGWIRPLRLSPAAPPALPTPPLNRIPCYVYTSF